MDTDFYSCYILCCSTNLGMNGGRTKFQNFHHWTFKLELLIGLRRDCVNNFPIESMKLNSQAGYL